MGNASAQVGCCCSRKEQGLLEELGLHNDRSISYSNSPSSRPQFLLTKIQNRFTFLKRKILNDQNQHQQPQQPEHSHSRSKSQINLAKQAYQKTQPQCEDTFTDIKQLYSRDEADEHQIGSLSSVSRCWNPGQDHDEVELLQAGAFFASGKFLLRAVEGRGEMARSVLIHQKLWDMAGEDGAAKIAKNQTVIIDYMESSQSFQYPSSKKMIEQGNDGLAEKVLSILKKSHAKSHQSANISFRFSQIKSISRAYESSNSIAFKVDQPVSAFKGILIKVPKGRGQVQPGFTEDLIFEAQIQKLVYNPEFVHEVKEEIILINSIDSTVDSYICIVEESGLSLHDLQHYQVKTNGDIESWGIWHSSSAQMQEFFSLSKYLYTLYRAIHTVQWLHDHGIVVGRLTPEDILVEDQGQGVKFRNFAYAIVVKTKGERIKTEEEKSLEESDSNLEFLAEELQLKFFNEFYSCPLIAEGFKKKYHKDMLRLPKQVVINRFLEHQLWSEAVLFENDLHSLAQCFASENVTRIVKGKPVPSQKLYSFMYKDIIKRLKYPHPHEHFIVLSQVEDFLQDHPHVTQSLIDQFLQEGKFHAGIAVCSMQINSLNLSQCEAQHPLQFQHNMVTMYRKRAQLQRMQGQPKQAVDDLKQVLFILAMHFREKLEERAWVTVELVEALVEAGELQDAVLKMQSAMQAVREGSLEGNVKLMGRVYMVQGKIYSAREELQKSLQYYQEAYNITLALLGESQLGDDLHCYNYQLVESLKKIARNLRTKGQYDECKDCLSLLFGQIIRLYGSSSPEYGSYLFESSQLEFDQRNLDESLHYLLDYLSLHRQHFQEVTEGRALIYSTLGTSFKEKGYFQKALGFIQKSLEIRLQIFGEKSMQAALSFNNMGLLYKAQGQFDNALHYFLQDIYVQEQVLGKQNPELATSYNNVGNVYKSLMNFDLAIEYYEKSLRLKMKTLKNNEFHMPIATTLQNLGLAYKGKENYLKAIKYYKDSLKIKQKLLEQTHPSIANSYGSMSIAYFLLEKYEQALYFSKSELEILTYNYGESDPNVAFCLYRIGSIYYGINNSESALDALYQARSILKLAPPVKQSLQQKQCLKKVEQMIQDCGGTLSMRTQFSPTMSDSSRSRKGGGILDFGLGGSSPVKGQMMPMETTMTSTQNQ